MDPRIEKALNIIMQSGGVDGSHHKQWVIDQVVRALTGESYEMWVSAYCDGEDGPDTYEWDDGVMP